MPYEIRRVVNTVNLFTRVNTLIAEFVQKIGIHPRNVYLGEDQQAELRKLLASRGFPTTANDYSTISGLKVYCVSSQSHLEVS